MNNYLHTIDYIASVKQVRDFMFGGLEKTLSLVKTSDGVPNFLLALALCCYTEYWGQLLIGKKIDFMVIVVNVLMNSLNVLVLDMNILLSIIIINMTISNVTTIYSDIRYGLAHAYMIDGNAKIVIESDGDCGILYDSTTKTYTFIVNKYFEDFKIAVNNFIYGLESGNEDLSQFRDIIESKPMLI